MRELRLDGVRVVRASIETMKTGNNIWAYVRFKSGSQTTRKYVGRVTAETQAECLRLGWTLVRKLKIAESNGWSWVNKPAKAKP